MSTIENNVVDDDRMNAKPRALIKPFVILIVCVAVVMGAIFGWHLFIGKMIGKSMSQAAAAPQTVSTVIAQSSTWQSRTRALGSVRAVRGSDLAAQASGVVDKLHIESGTEVKSGTVLLTLKPNDDFAKLAQLQAAAELAAITYKRDQDQLQEQAVSQATVDSDASNLKSARAQVVGQQALIEEKTVRAPFAGRLGIRQVDEGQYLAAGTAVVTLQSVDPIFIDFYLPQQALSRMTTGESVSATVDTYPGVEFTGKIVSINSKVDSASRNVQVRASFANAERHLVPGMFANIEIDNGAATSQITLPQSAITYNAYGDIVYVVEKSGAAGQGAAGEGTDGQGAPPTLAQQRFIQLGDTRGDQVAITSGVKAGEEIVSAGQLKLRNGSPIVIDNKIQPSNSAHPTPPNE